MVEVRSEKYLRSRFNQYFVEDPHHGHCDISLAKKEIGLESILNKNQILDAVGWSLYGKFRGYSRGILNRLNNF